MTSHTEPFAEAVNLELARAKRYRVFVSMISLDLGGARTTDGAYDWDTLILDVRANVRTTDCVALLHDSKLVLLMPETPRQGAEQAARRISTLVQERFRGKTDKLFHVPLEMASYPDAAGTQTVAQMLQELVKSGAN
ncbi:MAG: hypothetical protein ABIE70_13275 [bacterium]